MKSNPANGGTESAAVPDAIKKSEAKIADLTAQVDGLAKALEIALSTPVRKAVTSVAHIAKSEEHVEAKPLSKAEVQTKVRAALASGKLTKSQKDQLFSYSLGHIGLDQIASILETK